MTMSASFSASAPTTAPAAVNSESGRPDLMPAPGSTAISTPSALNFFTVSGEAATRGSEGSISLATAIFIRPPAARGARARANVSQVMDTGFATGMRAIFSNRAACPGASQTSGQENRHQGEDDGDGAGAVFHQLDEALIGLLMRLIIIAVGGRVRHFVMLCHRSPRSMFASREELPQSWWEGNGGSTLLAPP